MDFLKTVSLSRKVKIVLFAEPNGLALTVLEILLANHCEVVIVSPFKKKWQSLTLPLVETGAFIFCEDWPKEKPISAESYLFINLASPFFSRETERLLEPIVSRGGKILLVTSYRQVGDFLPPFLQKENIGIVYLGDLLGARSPTLGLEGPALWIRRAYLGKGSSISKNEVIYLISVKEAARQIFKLLFSFGYYGEEVQLLSKGIPAVTLAAEISKIMPTFRYKLKEAAGFQLPRKVKSVSISVEKEALLEETISNLSNEAALWSRPEKEIKKGLLGKVSLWLTLPFTFFCLPLFFTLGSLSLFRIALNYAAAGRYVLSGRLAVSADILASLSYPGAAALAKLPVADKLYGPVVFADQTVLQASRLVREAKAIFEESSDWAGKILGETPYSVEDYAQRLSLRLGEWQTELSFFLADLNSYRGLGQAALTQNINQVMPAGIIRDLGAAKSLVGNSAQLLGVKDRKTYLVLLQNNMELRPTGGFIGSFALVSFAGGRLGEITVQDVYAADGQLRGHVEPPAPLKNYLGEANWFLRDSNWNPDFQAAAETAEWFLNKEIEAVVDGVIGLDLNVVKDLLTVTGPIYLTDYQLEINSQNLYAETQREVEEYFFPGSTQKASFLTALTREILNRLPKLSQTERLAAAKVLFQNLKTKDVQLFFHDQAVQKEIAALNWHGAVIPPNGEVGGDWFGLVEANLGVNKANFFIQRSYSLSVEIGTETVKKTLVVDFENRANRELEEKGIYKVYVRLIGPPSLGGEAFKWEGQEKNLALEESLVKGVKEAGVFLQILPSQKRKLVITWQNPVDFDLSRPGTYRLYWRKQAGVAGSPVAVVLKAPLTDKPPVVYNSSFEQDFETRLSW